MNLLPARSRLTLFLVIALGLFESNQGFAQTLKPRLELAGHSKAVQSIAFNKDGTLLASGGADETVRLWDLKTGKEKSKFNSPNLNAAPVAFSPEGTLLAWGVSDSVSGQVQVVLYNVEKGAEAGSIKTESGANRIAFSGDGKQVVAGGYGFLTLADVSTLKPRELDARELTINRLAFRPHGKSIIAAIGPQDEVALWDVKSGKKKKAFVQDAAADLALSPDGKTVALALYPRVKLFDADTGKEKGEFSEPKGVYSVVFSPDGNLLFCGDEKGDIRIENVKSKKEVGKVHGRDDVIFGLAVSRDGKLLASSAGDKDPKIKVWDLGPVK